MKHLEIEQLKKYGERQLNAEEMTRAVSHLGECCACFDSFQQMFPSLSDAAREVSVDNLTADDAEIFHLDYEEYLRPYIDFEVDEVEREIVESHLQNCSFCARAVRELREFSDGLKLREIEKDSLDAPMFSKSAGNSPRRFANGNLRYLVLSAIAILILGFGGWLFWRQSETTTFVAENQTPTAAPRVSGNENSFNQLPNNSLTNPPIEESESPILPRDDNSANKKPEAVGGKIPESKQSEDERLLAALPTDIRAEFQNALRTQDIKLPAFIADLRENRNLRGESNNEKNIILSPNAQAVKDVRPTFSWKKFAADGESYVVTIFDTNFNQIAVSPSLRDTQWKSNVILERGKIYKWQVKTEKSADSYPAQFKVLDENAIVRLNIIENAAPNSPLVRGIGYASEGLLTEAAREFQKEIKNNPRGNLARKLKDSLTKKRKQ